MRKRFLKSEKLEFQACEVVVKRFALSAPHIKLTLNHNNKTVLTLLPALTEQGKLKRMERLFGAAFVKDAVYVDVEQGGMRLQGWISSNSFQRSQNDKQWVYINQRGVKDKLIHHAIKQVYEASLHPGRFPACLLYFTIDTNEVDVNVHPTKHEVRFQQPRLIHDFFTTHLSNALSAHRGPAVGCSVPQQEIKEPEVTFIIQPVAPPKTMRAVEPHSSWHIFNARYALLFVGEQPYLVDVVLLYQQWLSAQIQQLVLPLTTRLYWCPYIAPSLKSLVFTASIGANWFSYGRGASAFDSCSDASCRYSAFFCRAPFRVLQ